MVSCLMGDSTALASAIVRCCLIYFVVFAKSRFKKFYFVAKSRPKKFAIHNQSPLKKFTICDMLCAKLGKRFGGSRDVKTKNRKAFD